MVPPVVLMMAKSDKVPQYDLSSVESIMSAAAPLSRELCSAVEARFQKLYKRKIACFQAWGLSETSPVITALPAKDRWSDKRYTVGSIVPNVKMRIVDPETLQDVGRDSSLSTRPGEIWVSGPNVMLGYLHNPEATKQAFHVDQDGTRWFRTGDIGTLDEDMFVTIKDRLKEMIKYKGLQVIPSELEAKLLEHTYVADCAVLGRWVEDQATELPMAFVVLTAEAQRLGEAAAILAIEKSFNEKVANYKRLRGGISPTTSIPKSSAGKILRRQLREMLKATPIYAKL
jgi:acyl-CoA synthetase (AMP-forming)/AMP-acid ligase II